MIGHFNRVAPIAVDMHEPLYKNLFEIHFTFPRLLGLTQKDSDIMMMSASKIDLALTPKLEVVDQSFKYSKRLFVKTPGDTTLKNFSIDFAINVDEKYSMRSWNYMKNWYDLGWNSQNGELHYKRDMVGGIVAHIHDRDGVIVRRVEFKNVMCLEVGAMNFSWGEDGIMGGTVTFCADHWIDQYFNITQK